MAYDAVHIGGRVAADNAVSHADGLKDYFDVVRADQRFDKESVAS